MDSIQTIPLGLHAVSPLELLFRTVYALLCILHLLYIVYILCHILFSNDSFCSCSNTLVQLFQQPIIADHHQYCSISLLLVQSLFDYCSIIFPYMFWSWKYIPGISIPNKKTVPVIMKYSQVNRHHTSQDLPTFVLHSIGCREGLLPHRCERDLRNQFLRLGSKIARQGW